MRLMGTMFSRVWLICKTGLKIQMSKNCRWEIASRHRFYRQKSWHLFSLASAILWSSIASEHSINTRCYSILTCILRNTVTSIVWFHCIPRDCRSTGCPVLFRFLYAIINYDLLLVSVVTGAYSVRPSYTVFDPVHKTLFYFVTFSHTDFFSFSSLHISLVVYCSISYRSFPCFKCGSILSQWMALSWRQLGCTLS